MLKNGGVLQPLSPNSKDVTNTFRRLIIENIGIVDFNHREYNSESSKYYIYIDDLIFTQGAHLDIQDWKDGRDFLLVRKTSTTLDDALKKMNFSGYDPNNIHLEDFNAEYWSISATPEPTTYGAIFGTAGLALVTWRRRKRHIASVK